VKRIHTWLLRHAQAGLGSLGALARAPLATLMTVAVIGITLAMPAAMIVAVDNAIELSSGFEGPGRISLFLKRELGDAEAAKLAERLRRRGEIAKVEIISREEAYAEFKQQSGFGEALAALERNPLPTVLVVHPSSDGERTAALEQLAHELGRLDAVELAQLDLEWVKRLHAWLGVIERGVQIVGSLLAIAVLLIVGNTIRLAVLSRRDEIEVSKLVGATDAFIRRPFLYSGLAQGVLGALLAWLLVQASLWLLAVPVAELAGLYGSDFSLGGLGLGLSGALLAAGAALGWLGARIAVGRHLREIEPR
jgi:cell division transport system permease protein